MNFICTTCGTQFSESDKTPEHCAICEDDRQYVGLNGQTWTTLEELRTKHKTATQQEEESLTSFSIEPHFGIGQRAFLIQTASGNVFWDCISLLDETTIAYIRERGGLSAICISHPHYYTTMVEWSRAFGDVPIYLHQDDSRWVMRPDDCIQFWKGETKALPGGLLAIRCGGHFNGATVLHWPEGAGNKGALLTGDTIQVVHDRRYVSFMWSYPNFVPLDSESVQRIVDAIDPFEFDRIYGAFPNLTVASDGREAVRRSAERYFQALSGRLFR